MARRIRSIKAFTLVELLVVISIIALLISLLLPALSGAKTAAWNAIGLNNLRGITQATFIYAGDNKDALVAPLSNVIKHDLTSPGSYSFGRIFSDMVGSPTEYVSVGGVSLPRPGKHYTFADALMTEGYASDPSIFSDPAKPVRIPDGINDLGAGAGNRSFYVPRKGTPAALSNDNKLGTENMAYYQGMGFGLGYWPSSIWQTESYGGSANTVAYGLWDDSPISGSGFTATVSRYPKISERPYPSENMWLMDYNGTNQPQYIQMLGSYNYAPFRNGSYVHILGTSAAAFFDGHAGIVKNVDIYPYRLKASGADGGTAVGVSGILLANVGMMVTPWDTGNGALSYWPNPANFPDFIGARYWDSRNTNPLGGVNNFSGVDSQNVALGMVTK